jgi:hypothetical protein
MPVSKQINYFVSYETTSLEDLPTWRVSRSWLVIFVVTQRFRKIKKISSTGARFLAHVITCSLNTVPSLILLPLWTIQLICRCARIVPTIDPYLSPILCLLSSKRKFQQIHT